MTPIPPVYSFKKVEEFAQIHRLGTLAEFEYESLTIRRFNRADYKFKAWPIICLRKGSREADMLFFVEPGSNDALLPKEDEACAMDLPRYGLCHSTRRENPCSSWKVRHDFWERCLVFEVKIPYCGNKEETVLKSIKPYFRGPGSIKDCKSMPQPHSIPFMKVSFQLRLSTSTKDAELGALYTLMSARGSKKPGWYQQVKAFEYVMTFNDPEHHRFLFRYFPHMMDPIQNPRAVPLKLVERFKNLDSKQIDAYKDLLKKIPQGICVLPGGPGAGYVLSMIMLVCIPNMSGYR